ncbi:MAG: cell wall-binding repeat-containing protein, partial [Herbiconiux sp.]|nr:cell wall-binding repeat-containing protein [Herbiconiux sp.]
VVGGPLSVSEGVVAQLRSLAPRASVTRISGTDRYEASRALAVAAFPAGSLGVAAANGRDFPDALSGGALAARLDIPLLLVDGSAAERDVPTYTALRSLLTRDITLIGGPSSISSGIESSLSGEFAPFRITGANRYEVSLNSNVPLLSSYSTIYLATGANYPDALTGGVLAGITSSPLLLVPTDCVPRATLAWMASKNPGQIVLLGGPASLGDGVLSLTACSW